MTTFGRQGFAAQLHPQGMLGLKVNLGDDIQLLFPIQFNMFIFINCRQCLTNFHIRNLCTKIMHVGLPANFCYILLSFVVYIEVSPYCLCTVLTPFIYRYVFGTLWSLLCTLWSLFMYLVVPTMYLVVPIYVPCGPYYVHCGPYLCTLWSLFMYIVVPIMYLVVPTMYLVGYSTSLCTVWSLWFP